MMEVLFGTIILHLKINKCSPNSFFLDGQDVLVMYKIWMRYRISLNNQQSLKIPIVSLWDKTSFGHTYGRNGFCRTTHE